MINEGFKILEEGMAIRASDIDIVGQMDMDGQSKKADQCSMGTSGLR